MKFIKKQYIFSYMLLDFFLLTCEVKKLKELKTNQPVLRIRG